MATSTPEGRGKPAKPDTDAFKPTTFSREVDGKTQELTAHSPADAVRLKFDGWRDTGAVSKTAPARSSTPTNTAGTAGA
jgi:hypothetical protein